MTSLFSSDAYLMTFYIYTFFLWMAKFSEDHTIKQKVSDRKQKSKSEKSVLVLLEVKLHDKAHSQVKHSITHTHLLNPQQVSVHGSTLYSTLSLRAASCLVAKLPHLLYSNGQCPVTHNITHHWRGGPRWHATVHESPPISFHHAFRDFPI